MIEAILRSRDRMEVEVDSYAVFAGPFEGFESVLPSYPFQVGFARVRFDRPEGNRESNPVQTRSRNLGKVFFSLRPIS